MRAGDRNGPAGDRSECCAEHDITQEMVPALNPRSCHVGRLRDEKKSENGHVADADVGGEK